MKVHTLFLFACFLLVISVAATSYSNYFTVSAQEETGEEDYVIPGEQETSDRAQFSNILVKHPDHDEEGPSEDADSMLGEHEAMRCHVCRHAIKPAIINVIKEKAGKVDSKELIDEELRTLAHKHIYDLESKSIILRDIPEEKHFTDMERDENIHHFIEHLLWDEHLACQIYGLADVYVQQPRRRHWFARLVDHTICPCHNGKEVLRLDHDIDKYLMNHIAATTEAMKRYKMGHEIFEDENTEQLSNRAEEQEDVSPDDAKKDEGAQSMGKIWVDGDGHLDSHEQEAHQHHGYDDDGAEHAAHHQHDDGGGDQRSGY